MVDQWEKFNVTSYAGGYRISGKKKTANDYEADEDFGEVYHTPSVAYAILQKVQEKYQNDSSSNPKNYDYEAFLNQVFPTNHVKYYYLSNLSLTLMYMCP